ncbi:MAG: glycosyltransferase family 39 protein [Planctomycetota bacterium]|nr:glycosyltransferase family 39 protein [Planctomycetota bacterium]
MTPADDLRGYNIPRPDDAIAYAARTLAGFYRPWLLAAVLALQAAMLLAFHVSRSWHCLPDSALYLGLARSINEGQGYTFNGEFHAMVPPLYPLALAAVTRVFGPSYLAINCFQIVLALACTPAAFGLTRRMFGRDLALLATAAFAVNMVVWDVAASPISDLQFTLLAMWGMSAAVWSAANGPGRWAGAALAGLGLAAASLTRSNGFLIVPGAALAVWLGWRGRPAAARLAGAGLLAVLALTPVIAWNRYVAAHVSGEPVTYLSASHLSKPIAQMIPAMAHNLFAEVFKIASNLMVGFSDVPPGLTLILPALIAVGCLVALRRREPMLPLSLAGLVAALMVASGVKSRYFLFLYPGMVVLLLAGAVAVARLAARTSPRAWPSRGRSTSPTASPAARRTAGERPPAGRVWHTTRTGSPPPGTSASGTPARHRP